MKRTERTGLQTLLLVSMGMFWRRRGWTVLKPVGPSLLLEERHARIWVMISFCHMHLFVSLNRLESIFVTTEKDLQNNTWSQRIPSTPLKITNALLSTFGFWIKCSYVLSGVSYLFTAKGHFKIEWRAIIKSAIMIKAVMFCCIINFYKCFLRIQTSGSQPLASAAY